MKTYIKAWIANEKKLDQLINNKDYTLGWTSDIWKNKKRIGWIIILDYDTPNLKKVIQDCKKLQTKWKLGTAIILKTTKGYHLYIPDVINKNKLAKIIKTSKSDKLYLKMAIKSNYQFNIRLGRKNGKNIKYQCIIPSEHQNKWSYNHVKFLMIKYPQLIHDTITLKKTNIFNMEKAVTGQIRFTIYKIKKNEK